MDSKYVIHALWNDYKMMERPPIPFDAYVLSRFSSWFADAVLVDVRRKGNLADLECPSDTTISSVIPALKEGADLLFEVGEEYSGERMRNYRDTFLFFHYDNLLESCPEIADDEEIQTLMARVGEEVCFGQDSTQDKEVAKPHEKAD